MPDGRLVYLQEPGALGLVNPAGERVMIKKSFVLLLGKAEVLLCFLLFRIQAFFSVMSRVLTRAPIIFPSRSRAGL